MNIVANSVSADRYFIGSLKFFIPGSFCSKNFFGLVVASFAVVMMFINHPLFRSAFLPGRMLVLLCLLLVGLLVLVCSRFFLLLLPRSSLLFLFLLLLLRILRGLVLFLGDSILLLA